MERDNITKGSDGMSMLGKEVVIPTGCIAEIVRRSQHIQLEADMQSIPGLRKDIVGLLYGVFMSFFQTHNLHIYPSLKIITAHIILQYLCVHPQYYFHLHVIPYDYGSQCSHSQFFFAPRVSGFVNSHPLLSWLRATFSSIRKQVIFAMSF